MSWHNRDCGIPDLDWTDGYPSCIRCNSSASSIANGAMETPPPPAPPPSLKRSQLRCSWPPCVKYLEHFADEAGNDLTEFIIENIDGWNIDATDLPDDRAKFQKVRGASQSTDGSSETPELSSAYSNTTYTEPSDGPTETAYDNTHAVALGPTSTQSSDRIHQHLSGSDDFHVLRLYGSTSSDDPIHCSLEVAQLDDLDVPLYDALSYTWADLDGNKRNCMPIYIGSHFDVLLVTKNCHSALRRLRKGYDRLLWIDAICINQSDSIERSAQVNHMAKIYSLASRVLIYLGEESSESAETLTVVTTCAQSSVSRKVTAFLMELSKRPYFKRLWVIQEVALAIRASVIYGGSMMHWSDLCSAFQSCGAAPEWTKHFSAPVHQRSSHPSVFELLRDSKEALCVDPRDRLFGIIGLANPAERELLPIDYSLSTQKLYIGLAAYLIQKGDIRGVFKLSSSQRKYIPGLPSWVPDWTSIETQKSDAMVPELLVDHPSAALPSLFQGPVAKPEYRGWSINTSVKDKFAVSRKTDLLMSPPLVHTATGALLLYAIPLFTISRDQLKTHGMGGGMVIATWRIRHDAKLFNHAEELEIFVIPSCNGIVISRKHSAGIFSLQSFISIALGFPNHNSGLNEMHLAIDHTIYEESRSLKSWWNMVTVLRLISTAVVPDSARGESSHSVAFSPALSGLQDGKKSRRKGYYEPDEIGFNSGHFEVMDLMRTAMVNAIDPEDLAWRSPTPVNAIGSSLPIVLSQNLDTYRELPAREASVEDQISTWLLSVAQLRSQLQEQGGFSDAFQDLRGDFHFDPIFSTFHLRPGSAETILMDILDTYSTSDKGMWSHIHLSLILQGVHSVISRTTLDENLPWKYNRDRFWICLISFDLIVRLRLLLADRQLYARMDRSIKNPKRIVIV